jgi:hypothetical protein
MRWLVDECVAAALVHQLRAAGHDASYMADGGPSTIDAAVLQLAHEEGRLLLTEDKDFGDLVSGQGCRFPESYFCASLPSKPRSDGLAWQQRSHNSEKDCSAAMS